MRFCIINTDFPAVTGFMESKGFKCCPVIRSDRVSAPISAHSDVLYRKVSNDTFYISACQKANKGLLEQNGYKVKIYGGLAPGYKSECGLNFIINEKFCIYNPETVAGNLPGAKKSEKYLRVKQGYTSCSLAQVTPKAYITSDRGLCRALTEAGADCLQVKPGLSRLPGYNEGFIGGACVRDGNEMIFFGDIPDNTEKGRIIAFTGKYGVRRKFIKNFPLTDIGSAIIL